MANVNMSITSEEIKRVIQLLNKNRFILNSTKSFIILQQCSTNYSKKFKNKEYYPFLSDTQQDKDTTSTQK